MLFLTKSSFLKPYLKIIYPPQEDPESGHFKKMCVQVLPRIFPLVFVRRFCRESAAMPGLFSVGEVVVLSSTSQLAVSQGSVVSAEGGHIEVLLDRDLSLQLGWRKERFCLDRHVYQESDFGC